MARRYYSIRTGKNPDGVRLSLDRVKRLFLASYRHFEERGYFQEWFGKWCPDADEGLEEGAFGKEIATQILMRIRKDDLWPLEENIPNYSEDDLFDIIEFLHDHISQPSQVNGYFHDFCGCGWHYRTCERSSGQAEFRDALNVYLRDYEGGFELNAHGETVELVPQGLDSLLTADLPTRDRMVTERVASAIAQFRRRGSTPDERRIAVRELADVLELLKPGALQALKTQDSKDLFNISNNFGIRHHNDKQKIDYDLDVWLSWMFYHFLASIHVCLRLNKRILARASAAPAAS